MTINPVLFVCLHPLKNQGYCSIFIAFFNPLWCILKNTSPVPSCKDSPQSNSPERMKPTILAGIQNVCVGQASKTHLSHKKKSKPKVTVFC